MAHTSPGVHDLLFRPASPEELPSIDRLNRILVRELFTDDPRAVGVLQAALQRPLALLSPGSPEHRCIVADNRRTMVGLISTIRVSAPVVPSVLARRDDVLAAFVAMTPTDCLHVCSLTVLPDYRRCGIARRLVSIAGIEARALGIRKLSVTVFDGNRAAREFFCSAGFCQRERRSTPPSSNPRLCGDIVLLERDLSD